IRWDGSCHTSLQTKWPQDATVGRSFALQKWGLPYLTRYRYAILQDVVSRFSPIVGIRRIANIFFVVPPLQLRKISMEKQVAVM
ncbi:hypothetical protein VXQ18_16415, partial [Brucella abortus]|nr:hypothetical protein [Brucella abortus]